MAKRTTKKAKKTGAASRKSASARKTGARKTVARKTAPRKAAAAKTPRKKVSKKAIERTVRKPGRVRGSTRPTGPARKLSATSPAVAVALDAPPKRARRLTKKELGQFRELLLVKRAELIGDVSTLQTEALSKNRRDAAGDLSSMPIHMADLGTDNYEKEFTLGLIEGGRALLREIGEALARIENGTYGICAATGRPITKARLRARPWAKYCYEYMLAQEKGQESEGF